MHIPHLFLIRFIFSHPAYLFVWMYCFWAPNFPYQPSAISPNIKFCLSTCFAAFHKFSDPVFGSEREPMTQAKAPHSSLYQQPYTNQLDYTITLLTYTKRSLLAALYTLLLQPPIWSRVTDATNCIINTHQFYWNTYQNNRYSQYQKLLVWENFKFHSHLRLYSVELHTTCTLKKQKLELVGVDSS